MEDRSFIDGRKLNADAMQLYCYMSSLLLM